MQGVLGELGKGNSVSDRGLVLVPKTSQSPARQARFLAQFCDDAEESVVAGPPLLSVVVLR
jgi:hypothetical protein